jgi:hypothetical protein
MANEPNGAKGLEAPSQMPEPKPGDSPTNKV